MSMRFKEIDYESEFFNAAKRKAMDEKEFKFYEVCEYISPRLGEAVLSGHKPRIAKALRELADVKVDAVVYQLLQIDREYLEELLSCADPDVRERLMVRLATLKLKWG